MLGGRKRRLPRRGVAAPQRHRQTVLRIVAFSLLCCGVLVLFTLQAFEVRRLRRDLDDLNVAQAGALGEQAALRERLGQKDNPQAIEDEARERLGWVMRGEEKVVFVGGEEE